MIDAAPSCDDRPVYLVGFMGSGKSTVAELAARLTGWQAWDTDDLVERREGRSIEQIFRESGEGRFRYLEWEVLRQLGSPGRSVVATGGGLFAGLLQRRFMARHGRTVWLDVPLDECLRRVEEGGGLPPGSAASPPVRSRPLWQAADPRALRVLYEKRRAVYALAGRRVQGVGEPEAVARMVLQAVGAWGS